MNLKKILFVLIMSSTFYLSAFGPGNPDTEKESLILNAILQFIEVYHFDPLDITNDFSEKAFDNYLKSIDGRKRFLIQSEVDQMTKYKTLLDDQANGKSFEFFELSIGIINDSRQRAKRVYEKIIAEGIDKDSKETIELDSDKRTYANSEQELEDLWRKLIKYDLVKRLDAKVEAQDKRIELEKEESKEDGSKKEDSKKVITKKGKTDNLKLDLNKDLAVEPIDKEISKKNLLNH